MNTAEKTHGTQTVDTIEGRSVGISGPDASGSYTALTLVESKDFRTPKAAARWLAKRGYGPTGERLSVCG